MYKESKENHSMMSTLDNAINLLFQLKQCFEEIQEVFNDESSKQLSINFQEKDNG